MERIFTKSIGRFVKGESRDYPLATWDQIAKSGKESIDTFSVSVSEALAGGNAKEPKRISLKMNKEV